MLVNDGKVVVRGADTSRADRMNIVPNHSLRVGGHPLGLCHMRLEFPRRQHRPVISGESGGPQLNQLREGDELTQHADALLHATGIFGGR